jgi:hypothetical protein
MTKLAAWPCMSAPQCSLWAIGVITVCVHSLADIQRCATLARFFTFLSCSVGPAQTKTT